MVSKLDNTGHQAHQCLLAHFPSNATTGPKLKHCRARVGKFQPFSWGATIVMAKSSRSPTPIRAHAWPPKLSSCAICTTAPAAYRTAQASKCVEELQDGCKATQVHWWELENSTRILKLPWLAQVCWNFHRTWQAGDFNESAISMNNELAYPCTVWRVIT